MAQIRFGNLEWHPVTVDYRKAEPRPLTGSDRPLGLDPDPDRWSRHVRRHALAALVGSSCSHPCRAASA
jgi:hypothetical protein